MLNKYYAKRVTIDGHTFHSQAEGDYYQLLKLMEKAGEVTDIQLQVKIHMTLARILYVADFRVFDTKLEENVFIECKGYETPEWKMKKKLYPYYGPGRLRIYKGRGLRFDLVEEIIPKTSSYCWHDPSLSVREIGAGS